jgi:hypothetical protein
MYNVRDLMANLATFRCAVTWQLCCDTGGSWGCGATGGCGQLGMSGCDVGRTDVTYFLAVAATDPEVQKHQMAALKAQLRAAVAEIEKQEKAVEKK